MHPQPYRHQRVRAPPVIKDEHILSCTVDPQPPFLPSPPRLSVGPHLTCSSSQFVLLLTEMQATRKAFRSLRSFTHAARHHPSASELVSDPIADDDHSTPEKRLRPNQALANVDEIPETPIKSHSLSASQNNPVPLDSSSSRVLSSIPQSSRETSPNSNQPDFSSNPRLLSFNSVPGNKDPKVLFPSDVPSFAAGDISPHVPEREQSHSFDLLGLRPTSSTVYQHLVDDETLNFTKPQTPSDSPTQYPRLRRTQNRARNHDYEIRRKDGDEAKRSKTQRKTTVEHVFNLDENRGRSESPAIKRRRTRSSTRRNREARPGPEMSELLLRQLVDTATAEERKEILEASESPSGRRKLFKLLGYDEPDRHERRRNDLRSSHNDGDVEWLGTAYDGVEEVALTPSPKSKRKSRHSRLTRAAELESVQKEQRSSRIERVDTSESPERIMRRRSKRLNRDIDKNVAMRTAVCEAEKLDSSQSPGRKRRRSHRLTRGEEMPPSDITVDTGDSENSDASRESIAQIPLRRQNKNRNGGTRSRPLPRPEAGVLSERLQKRIPLTSRQFYGSKKPKGNLQSSGQTQRKTVERRNKSSLRRSTRLRKSRKRPVIDLDADDEVLEEGSADDSKEDNEVGFSDVENPDEEGDGEDEEDDEMQIEDMEDVDGDEDDEDEDADDEEDDDDYEERAWKESLKRKQIKRRGKRSVRRKRTQPRDVFRTEGEFLTAREQKQRLDFLVEQSAVISNHLHQAMGEASRKPSVGLNGAAGTNGGSSGDSGDAANETKRKEETFVPPSGSGCELQPHQKEGVDWLLTLDSQGLNAILADEMGLGKTIQAVSFLASLVISGSRGPHLVVAPKNVCQHWADEVRKWYPKELNVVTHLGNADERLEKLRYVLEEDNFDILITSFDHALRDLFTRKRRDNISWEHLQVLRAFRKVEFEYLIVDEAHRLKNDASKINQAIRGFNLVQRRLLLTGTPLSNNLQELWSLMNVLNPKIFSSKATFEAWFSAPFASKTKKRAKVSLTHAEQSVIVDRLHTVIRPFFRRRVRADVCPSFTSADEVIVRCPLSSLQRAVLLHLQRRAKAQEAGITNVIMGMRAASNHPYIFSEALYESHHSNAAERMVASSGKFVFLHYALPRLIRSGHRVLIFSQFKRVLDFIEDLLIMLNFRFGRLDGATSSDDRISGLHEFNRDGSDVPVFLLTTRAGGVGLNLQTADTVILFDSDWNPSADLQAVSRIQRIGQKKTVHILRLVTEKSVDDIIVETARHKLRTQNVAVGAGKFNTSRGATLDCRMRQKDLEELLKRLELQNYAEDQDEEVQTTTNENSSPESLSPKRVSLTTRDRRFEEWGNQLLRKDESSLASVDNSPIWVDLLADGAESSIPHWLNTDADLQSAAKALRCTDVSAAGRVYDESVQMKLEEGKYSRKDRALRARRQNCVIYISDADSENESEDKDPTVNITSDEDDADHVIPVGDVVPEIPIVKRKAKKGIVQPRIVSINDTLQRQQGLCVAAPGPHASSKEVVSSTSQEHALKLRPDMSQVTTLGQIHSQKSLLTQTKGSQEPSHGPVKIWGLPTSSEHHKSRQEQRGARQLRVPLPTAHLKRLPRSSRPVSLAPRRTTEMGITSIVTNGSHHDNSKQVGTTGLGKANSLASRAMHSESLLTSDAAVPAGIAPVVLVPTGGSTRITGSFRTQFASLSTRKAPGRNLSMGPWDEPMAIPTEQTVSMRYRTQKTVATDSRESTDAPNVSILDE